MYLLRGWRGKGAAQSFKVDADGPRWHRLFEYRCSEGKEGRPIRYLSIKTSKSVMRRVSLSHVVLAFWSLDG